MTTNYQYCCTTADIQKQTGTDSINNPEQRSSSCAVQIIHSSTSQYCNTTLYKNITNEN